MKRHDLTIAVVGRNGQVAWELRQSLASLGTVCCIGRPELDLTDPDSIRSSIRRLRPDVLVNAAAYTGVDQAESEPGVAMNVNANAQQVLAEEAKEACALFITYSSDYVFNGEKSTPYLETDAPGPLNVYGGSKLAGDCAVESVGDAYLIFRTSWVYGARGKNFLTTILRLATEREELRIVDDQVGAPTWARDIANATSRVLAKLIEEPVLNGKETMAAKLRDRCGVYNMTAAGSVSWCGFAKAIIQEAARRRLCHSMADIVPISSREYPLPARRPPNSRLSNSKLGNVFRISLPEWRESLGCVLDEIATQRCSKP